MIKALLAFAFIFALLYFVIPMYRNMTGKEAWSLIKTILFSSFVAALSLLLLVIFVILF